MRFNTYTSITLIGIIGRGRPGVLEGVQIAGVDRSVHPQQCLCIIDTEKY